MRASILGHQKSPRLAIPFMVVAMIFDVPGSDIVLAAPATVFPIAVSNEVDGVGGTFVHDSNEVVGHFVSRERLLTR